MVDRQFILWQIVHYRLLLPVIIFSFLAVTGVSQDTVSIIYSDENETWHYRSDAQHNKIPDFSYSGYKQGMVSIPDVPVVMTIGPISGDNTAQIQMAIDELSNVIPDSNGIRGALLLLPGRYEIWGTIKLDVTGIVLRGTMSNDPDSVTVLLGMGNVPNQRNLIEVGNHSIDWRREVAGSRIEITSEFVPVNSRTLLVDDVQSILEGDRVMLVQSSTFDWLESISFGETASDPGWETGEIDIYYHRKIQKLYSEEKKIVLDAPIYDHLDHRLAPSYLYRWDGSNLVRQSGIEDLQILIDTEGDLTENHVWTAIEIRGVEDCWVSSVDAWHFGYAAVNITRSSQVSVLNCRGLEPHSQITGARRYNFAVNAFTNNVLFQDCEATWARHAFICNGAGSASGIVFNECRASYDLGPSEGHRRWSQGLLYDEIVFDRPEDDRVLGLYNRGSFGTGHGWGAVHSVAWNVMVPATAEMVLQKPPGRQNYAIGVHGRVTRFGPFLHDGGWQELSNRVPEPPSLYDLQLVQRILNGPLPDAPVLHPIQDIGVDSFLINWSDISADESGYIIEYSSDGNSFNRLDSLPANSTEYQILPEHLMIGSSIRVTAALKESNVRVYSNEIELEVTTSLDNFSQVGISLLPNPVRQLLVINTTRPINRIAIYNSDGILVREMVSNEINSAEITVGDLSAGVYFCLVRDNHGLQQGMQKFIKSN